MQTNVKITYNVNVICVHWTAIRISSLSASTHL